MPFTTVDPRIVIALISVIFSFMFSASETALTSLGRIATEKLQSQGSRLIKLWVDTPNRVLITILIGNNIASILASSMVTLYAKKYYPDSVSILIGVFTFLFIISAEILPKIIARQKADALALFFLRFLKISTYVLWPFIFIIEKITQGIVSLFGLPSSDFRKPYGEDEIEQTIDLARKEGGLDPETGEVLSNLMDFNDLIARDVMIQRSKIHFINMKTSQEEIFRQITEEGYSRIPVCRESMDQVVGVLHVKDLIGNMHITASRRAHWTRLIRRPYFVSEMASLGDILRDMKRWGTHMALVRNEGGVLTGLVTLEDLIEEIVGEIRDEHDDPEEAGFEAAIGAPKLVVGDMSIVDFNDSFDTTLPMDVSYSSVNGYMLYKCGGKLPTVGTLIIDDDVTFRVHSISEQGIVTVEVIEQERGAED